LLAVDTQGWRDEYQRLREEFALYGDRVPAEFSERLDSAMARLGRQLSQR
jgi:GTP-dependent phosphoenolpyruvate carboxykinase